MKPRVVIILLCTGLFAVFQFYLCIKSNQAIFPKYKVIRQENEFEIRSYAKVEGSDDKSGRKLVAVLKFGGYASPRVIELYSDKLRAVLSQNKISQSGDFHCLQYNSQYQIFGRNNEILVGVDVYDTKITRAVVSNM